MAVTWIEYNGKKILYSNFSGQKSNDVLFPTLEEAAKQFTLAEGKVRHLINFTGAVLDSDFMARAKETAKTLPIIKTQKDAYVGITGVKKVLLQGYLWATKEPANVFDTESEALEWLSK
ncbi:MAG: hypothetical protein LLG37_04990 [Spirochaetia bacterium]|nr:hypothetical protein [Spirochaetia bacterium]